MFHTGKITMHTSYCTMHTTQYTMHTTLCTLHIAHYTLHIVFFTLLLAHYIMHYAQKILFNVVVMLKIGKSLSGWFTPSNLPILDRLHRNVLYCTGLHFTVLHFIFCYVCQFTSSLVTAKKKYSFLLSTHLNFGFSFLLDWAGGIRKEWRMENKVKGYGEGWTEWGREGDEDITLTTQFANLSSVKHWNHEWICSTWEFVVMMEM